MKPKTVDIRNHTRILNTITSPVEKPLLRWLAVRMPPWVNSDMLTLFGVFGALVIFAGYTLSNWNPAFLWLASLGFVLNWFGDSLDGTLARVRHTERPVYGFYVDHATDAFVEIMIFLGIGLSPFVRFEFACLALIGYLLLSVLVYVRTCVRGEFAISYGKLGPTEVRIIAILANTVVFFIGNPQLTLFQMTQTIYDWGVIVIVLILGVISITTTVRQANRLAKIDPPKKIEGQASK